MTSTTYPLNDTTAPRSGAGLFGLTKGLMNTGALARKPAERAQATNKTERTGLFEVTNGLYDATIAVPQAPAEAARSPFAMGQGLRNAARLLSSVVSVAVLAAVVTIAMLAISAYATPQDNVWPWFGAWAVAVAGLIAISRLKDRFARSIMATLVRMHAHHQAALTERAIAEAVRNDPRMREELQVMLDRSEWTAMLARMPH